MNRTLNYVFGFALLGSVVMSFITPWFISVLFTPPVSFGTNCEPAAAWSMSKLHVSELTGLTVGALLGVGLSFYMKKKTEDEGRSVTTA